MEVWLAENQSIFLKNIFASIDDRKCRFLKSNLRLSLSHTHILTHTHTHTHTHFGSDLETERNSAAGERKR